MSEVIQSKILYDDRYSAYRNMFTETKVVHKPFLKEYIEAIMPDDDDTVLHLIVYDSKDDDNKSYLSDVKEYINKSNVVPHIISPRSYYRLPNCPTIHYYIELAKGSNEMIQKLSKLIEEDDNKDNIMLNLTQDIYGIILQYQTPTGKKF